MTSIRKYTPKEVAELAATIGGDWSITPQLRYVERAYPTWCDGPDPTYTVLQQLWQSSNGSQKWEDVPTVREE